MRLFSVSSARVLAGVAGAGASFIAGGVAQEKYEQYKMKTGVTPLLETVNNNLVKTSPWSLR